MAEVVPLVIAKRPQWAILLIVYQRAGKIELALCRQDNFERKYKLCVVPKGIHHKVIDASPQNVLCVVCTPPFNLADESIWLTSTNPNASDGRVRRNEGC